MRYSLILLLSLFLCTGGRAQDTLSVTSEIKQATVFLEGAQVLREAKSPIPAGRRTLIFTGLTTDMDPSSIQVNSSGDDFMVLSVSHRLNFGDSKPNGQRQYPLFDRIDALDKREAILRTRVQIAKDEEEILKANRVVAGNQNGLDANELRASVQFQRERLTAIRMLYLEISDSLVTIDDSRDLLLAQIAEMGKKKQTKTTAEIVVVTEAKQATRSNFTLTYLVPNASWTPKYDVRVADISQPVDLRYKADVQQQTGEDWTDIKLKLSTGDPSASALAPSLNPWRLTNNSRPPSYQPTLKKQVTFGYRKAVGIILEEGTTYPLIGATVLIAGTNIGTVTDIDGRFELEVPADATELSVSYTGFASKSVPISELPMKITLDAEGHLLEEVVVTGYATAQDVVRSRRSRSSRRKKARSAKNLEDGLQARAAGVAIEVNTTRKATTVNFDIVLPYSIPSDGKARIVEIKQHSLPAEYTHFAVPKFESSAYLTAAITDWEQYDLLSGEINLFFEGTYLGISRLETESTNDTLQLSLGKDPNVVVERKALAEYRERNFLGNKVTQSRGYSLNIRNNKSQAINLIIKDQIPVSGDERIEVKHDIEKGGQLDEETGIITWQTSIAPNIEWKRTFNYTTKYSNGMFIELE